MSLKIAAVQLCSTEDVSKNLDAAANQVRAASAAGAGLIGLPENFAYLGSDRDHKLALAETVQVGSGPGAETDGPILARMKQVAWETGAWLLLGGFPEKIDAESARLGNTSVILDASGTVQAVYRKMHLFDIDAPGGQSFRESETVVPGSGPVTCETPWATLGLAICYDLRFPELFRHYAKAGARLVAVPAAFTRETGKDHWHVLLRARAIENQMYVFAPAQFGFHGGRRSSYGHALVVDPWGVVLAECGDKEGFALAPVDFEFQDEIRKNLPCLSHRLL